MIGSPTATTPTAIHGSTRRRAWSWRSCWRTCSISSEGTGRARRPPKKPSLPRRAAWLTSHVTVATHGTHHSLTGAQRAARYRAAKRAQGLRLRQFWLPDLRDPAVRAAFAREAVEIRHAVARFLRRSLSRSPPPKKVFAKELSPVAFL